MKNLLFIALMLCPMVFGSGAGDGRNKGPQDKPVRIAVSEDYHKLVVSAPFTVSFSDTARVISIDIPNGYRKYLAADFDHGTLRLALRNLKNMKTPPKVNVVLPTNAKLNDIELSNAAHLNVGRMERDEMALYLTGASSLTGTFTTKRIAIEQAGASDLRAHVATDNISLNLSAASSAELRGRALIKMELTMIEGSNIDAEKFEAKRIEGSLDGASHALLWCSERMRIPLRNNSHLVYIGRPIVVNCPTYDLSTVTHK